PQPERIMEAMTDMLSTSASLLERLRRPNEEAAWNRFVDLYAPLLRIWAGRFGLQASDADDLVQEVFATLLRDLPRFVYRLPKRFRVCILMGNKNSWHKKLEAKQ